MFRHARPHDQPALERFLQRRRSSSLFLLSNLTRAGIEDGPSPLQGHYQLELDGEAIVGVLAHYRNRLMIIQAPHSSVELAHSTWEATRRPLGGLIGPWGQIEPIRRALGLDDRACSMFSREHLYALSIKDLREPAWDGCITRDARTDELELLTHWRAAYRRELSETVGEDLMERAREQIEHKHALGCLHVLEREGELLAMTAWNARTDETTQVGNVYTPPELRGRGHARRVVAGHLLQQARQGFREAILFTGSKNVPAQRAYRALGFVRQPEDYGLILFEEPVPFEVHESS